MSQAVERAIVILEMLSRGPLGPSMVAEELGVHRTTALRLMQDLENGGLARRRSDGLFTIGYRLAGLAQAALEQFDLRELAHADLVALSGDLGATVHSATIERGLIVYTDKVEPHGKVRLYSEVGKPVRLHASGIGKAILAFLPSVELKRLLEGYRFERFTETTITSSAEFAEELHRIRQRGWSTDDGEFESFVNCVAVPLHDSTGAVRSAISVTTISAQTNLNQLLGNLPRIQEAADAISYKMGWTP